MNNRQKTYRFFFALWPSDQVRQSIVEEISSLPLQSKGRVITPNNLHVTLHFVGQVTESTKDCMHTAAQSVDAEAFQLNMDKFGHFPKSKIFWMGAQSSPSQINQLHQKLGAAIKDCGFNPDTRQFSPHVTLMRKYSGPVPAQIDFSIPWHVEEFVLVESITYKEGVKYQVIEKYPLT